MHGGALFYPKIRGFWVVDYLFEQRVISIKGYNYSRLIISNTQKDTHFHRLIIHQHT